jgi:hypothetical protein
LPEGGEIREDGEFFGGSCRKEDLDKKRHEIWWERATNARMHSNIFCGTISVLDFGYSMSSRVNLAPSKCSAAQLQKEVCIRKLPVVSVAPSRFFYADAMQKPIEETE